MHVVPTSCIRLSLIASPRNLAASNGRCKQAVFKVVPIFPYKLGGLALDRHCLTAYHDQ
jgi:hypothetical protein